VAENRQAQRRMALTKDDDYYYRGRKKRRWFESLGEIFD
jgi:hypothetical protein